MFYKDESLVVLIDGISLFHGAKNLNFSVDFKRLRNEFSRRGKLLRMKYFTTVKETDEENPLVRILDFMSYNGYDVRAKYIKSYDGERYKGSIDVDLACDIIQYSNKVNHIVIFSGNSDLVTPVKIAQNNGVRVSVASTLKGDGGMISDDLRRVADNFIELEDIKDAISREFES